MSALAIPGRSYRPSPRLRGGAQRDQYGRLIPGSGSPTVTPADGSLTPAHDWSGFEGAFKRTPPATTVAPAPALDTLQFQGPEEPGHAVPSPLRVTTGEEPTPAPATGHLTPEAQQAAVANSAVPLGSAFQRNTAGAVAASAPTEPRGNFVMPARTIEAGKAHYTDGEIAGELARNRALVAPGGMTAFNRQPVAAPVTSQASAIAGVTSGAHDAAPFRGSTADEVRDFYATDPNRADNDYRLQTMAERGGQYTTQYGTVGAPLEKASNPFPTANRNVGGPATDQLAEINTPQPSRGVTPALKEVPPAPSPNAPAVTPAAPPNLANALSGRDAIAAGSKAAMQWAVDHSLGTGGSVIPDRRAVDPNAPASFPAAESAAQGVQRAVLGAFGRAPLTHPRVVASAADPAVTPQPPAAPIQPAPIMVSPPKPLTVGNVSLTPPSDGAPVTAPISVEDHRYDDAPGMGNPVKSNEFAAIHAGPPAPALDTPPPTDLAPAPSMLQRVQSSVLGAFGRAPMDEETRRQKLGLL